MTVKKLDSIEKNLWDKTEEKAGGATFDLYNIHILEHLLYKLKTKSSNKHQTNIVSTTNSLHKNL